ncbi:hypothetical protein HCN44_010646 [Aphidius gifuensis]|uniref:HP domain-containing protein n=1 Tax=Aphidius gifuensis TaxID=684658 RepID=A0A834XR01_APHGI|nr:hypothetical protein HCN44_010646 [Aphidius gifuensis]
MVAAGANALMANNESATNKVTDNSIISTNNNHHHTQQMTSDSTHKKTTTRSLESSRKKESPSTSTNRTTSIRETKTSRLRAASIISPVVDKGLRRSKRLSVKQNNSLLYNNQSPLMTHKQYEAKEISTRQKMNQHNEVLSRPSSTITSTSQIPKRTTTSTTTTTRSGNHDSTEVIQRVDALTALTKATIERVERLTSPPSSSSLLLTSSLSSNDPSITSNNCTKKLQKSSITSTNTNKNNGDIKNTKILNRNQPLISILKHKTIDIYDDDNNGDVVDEDDHDDDDNYQQKINKTSFNISPIKKLGILKKRSSLDENEILRRSKCRSSDFVTFEDINSTIDKRPILKIERRSSLDELSNKKLTKCTDYPASILKRKWSKSREDNKDDVCSPELQSILKKYQNDGTTITSSTSLSTTTSSASSSSTTTSTISTTTSITNDNNNTAKIIGVTWTDNNDTNQEVRPILKKKLSREESSSSDPPSLEPRPILKKKSSTESDEHDDKPKKTILKTSRRSSEETNNNDFEIISKNISVLKNNILQRRTNSLPECDTQLITVKPILKNSINYNTTIRSSRIDLITSKNNNLLRKRARSVGQDVYNDNNTNDQDDVIKFTSVKSDLLDEKYFSHNASSSSSSSLLLSPPPSPPSITPIVSFKLSSRDESIVSINPNNNTGEMNCKEIDFKKKLDEYSEKLGRLKNTSRRHKNRENINLSSSDHDADVKINSNDIEFIDEKIKNNIIDEEINDIYKNKKIDEIDLYENQDDRNNILDTMIMKKSVNVSSIKDNNHDKCFNENKKLTINFDVKESLNCDKYNKNKCEYGHNNIVEVSKLSLNEQIEKVFDEKIHIDTFIKADESVNRAQRRPFSRFRTQPVTSEEVDLAAKYIPNNITDSKHSPSDKHVNEKPQQKPKSILKSSSSSILSAKLNSSTDSSDDGSSISPVVLRRVKHKNDNIDVPFDELTKCSVDFKKLLKTRSVSVDESDNCHVDINNYLSNDIKKKQRPISATMQSLNLPSVSIRDRLAALQRSGSTDWKRRVTSEPINASFIIEKQNFDNATEKTSYFQKEKDEIVMKQGRLADRLEKLESATEGWRKRVTTADAVQFSVAGKMRVDQIDKNIYDKAIFDMGNCVSERKKKLPKTKEINKKDNENNNEDDFLNVQDDEKKLVENSITSKKENGDVIKNEESIHHVPRADDETFTSFFDSISVDKCREESLDLTEDDFNQITSFCERLGSRRTVQVQRRRVSTKNPLRTLAARTDIKEEYTEIKMGVADRMIKLNNIEKLGKNSTLAVEALAGLASTENFSAITLKDIEKTNSIITKKYDNKIIPLNNDIMLIIIKGRRHVQVRLIEPIASNINSGDNYILFTKNEIFNYIGKYCNVIEKSRGAEIALRIMKNKDFGCCANKILTIYEEDSIKNPNNTMIAKKFWKYLGIDNDRVPDIVDAGHPDEDEFYESSLIDTNAVYELSNDKLIPIDKYWGMLPKIKMLDPSKSILFDFGSEMYIWNGKCVSIEKRKLSIILAEQLWMEGFDYTDCTVSPINVASIIGNRQLNTSSNNNIKKSNKRPNWCLLVKLTQHMETILFREKFLDWPNTNDIINIRKINNNINTDNIDSNNKIIIEKIDVNNLSENTKPDVDLIIEGCHLGRGTGWFDEEFKRQYIVSTSDITIWHIEENSYTLLNDKNSFGQFFSGDSYIVRWMYTIIVTGRGLSGKPSKHAVEGRDRCAYFIWQGKMSSLNKQGTAALLTIELDKEEGPQIRISEGFEPAAFLNLFNGKMIIHMGKKKDINNFKKNTKTIRAYICRGTEINETFLIEVSCSTKQLRSRASLIFIDKKNMLIYVWHGKHSLLHIQKNAIYAAQQLKEFKPIEAGFNYNDNYEIREINEGNEPDDLFEDSMNNKKINGTLTKTTKISLNYTPRLFHFSSNSGEFIATELFCLFRSNDTTPFPFLQEELYQVNQPALFLFDNKDELWLWQGWWPDTGSDDQTGSGAIRWQAERREAMNVAIQYWKKQHSDAKKCAVYLVWAGLEPLEFINLFPTWTYRDEIAELNIQDGRAPGQILSVESELARLTQSTYPPAQLLQRPLPEGVDPTSLELYLSPQHFQELLGMKISEFKKLPSWKQIDIKKKIGLF